MQTVTIFSMDPPGQSIPAARVISSIAVNMYQAVQKVSSRGTSLCSRLIRDVQSHSVIRINSVIPSYPRALQGKSSLRKQSLMRKTGKLVLLTKKTIATPNIFQQLKRSKKEAAMHSPEMPNSTKEAHFCLIVKQDTRCKITLLAYSTSMLKDMMQTHMVSLLSIQSLHIKMIMLIENCSITLYETDYFLSNEQTNVKIIMFLNRAQFQNSYHEKFQNKLDSMKHLSQPSPKNFLWIFPWAKWSGKVKRTFGQILTIEQFVNSIWDVYMTSSSLRLSGLIGLAILSLRMQMFELAGLRMQRGQDIRWKMQTDPSVRLSKGYTLLQLFEQTQKWLGEYIIRASSSSKENGVSLTHRPAIFISLASQLKIYISPSTPPHTP